MLAIKRSVNPPSDIDSLILRVTRGEAVLFQRPKSGNYIVMTEEDYNELNREKKSLSRADLKETMRKSHEIAIANGTADIRMEEIDEIVAEVRLEKRIRASK